MGDERIEIKLQILYQDDYLVAINKPNGLLVHRTYIAEQDAQFALQLLRDQIGQKVFPIHRLDRKTSGVLMFALDSETVKLVQQQFASPPGRKNQSVTKKYIAIVRGWFPDAVEVDYALTNDRGKTQEAITHFKLIEKTEVNVPFGKHETSRYSLIEAHPKTGRQHQIRKHLNHLRHPIIGDRPHGCNKQNRLFKERWQMNTMMLHAEMFTCEHPILNEKLKIVAPLNSEFIRMLNELEFAYLR